MHAKYLSKVKTHGTCWTNGTGINKHGVFLGNYVVAINMTSAVLDDDRGVDTLIHEMAHVFAHWESGYIGHGKEWQDWYDKLSKITNKHTSSCNAERLVQCG